MKVLDLKQLEKKMKGLSEEWFISGDNRLSLLQEFETVKDALAFMACVGAVAEKLDHHPELTWDYKKVSLRVTSHEAGGLTNLDFKFAKAVSNCL
jgi:4a-hydroxytetrahydrobiopterin dehydratase